MKTTYYFLILALISWSNIALAQVEELPHPPSHYEAEARKAAQQNDVKNAAENHFKAASKYIQLADAEQTPEKRLNLLKAAIRNLNQAKHFFQQCRMANEVQHCEQLAADISKDVQALEGQIRNQGTGCEEGKITLGKKTTHIWHNLPNPKGGQITMKITAAVERGDLSGMGNFFRAIAKAIGLAASYVRKVPGGYMLTIPMNYFKGLANVGGAIVDAGERIRDGEEGKYVNLQVIIPRINKRIVCQQRLICKNGQIVPHDRIVVSERDKRTDYVKKYDAIPYSQAAKRLNEIKNGIIKEMEENTKKFAESPCTGNIKVPQRKPRKPRTPKKDCSKLKKQVKDKEQEVNRAKTKVINATKRYNEWRKNSRKAPALKKQMETAQKAAQQARQKFNQLKRRKANLERNYRKNGQEMPAAEKQKFDRQIAAAGKDMKIKLAALQKAKKAYQAVSPKRGQNLKAKMQAAKKASILRQKELTNLKAQLQQCLNAK